jgi:adenine-specific DNA-methyltransferase
MQSAARTQSQVVAQEKSGGATYTPTMLADFVANKIIDSATLPAGKIRILDPAVGDGELLSSILTRIVSKTNAIIAVYGFDTDGSALALARRRLAATFPKVELYLEHGNFLNFVLSLPSAGRTPSMFATQAPAQDFDLIIANPPYVRTQIMGSDEAQKLGDAFGLSGRVDLYPAFLLGMAQVLRPGGTAGIIVSNRFMTTKGGASLRAALRTRFALGHIWDLGDTKLFDAAVLPAVILAKGRNGHEPGAPDFTSVYETDESATLEASDPIAALSMLGTIALEDGRRFRVQHGVLDASGPVDDVWRIATTATDQWLATVATNTGKTFGDIGKIRVGVKTCADKVFIRSDWQAMPKNERPELLRPLTTHHSAGRFRASKPTKERAILYPHESVGGQRRPAELSDNPKSRAYLEAHRATLEGRAYVIEAGRRWYEIWVPQEPSAWAAPKLVFRDISERPTFWLDLNGTIVNGDCYWLTAERPGDESLLWLAAAVANSTFIEAFYDHRFNNKLYAGRRRFITQYVELFPLPDPTTSLALEIVDIAKAIFAHAGSQEAVAMEAKLDPMIWQAFGLRVEEISRVGVWRGWL